jgi:hypothetical protein
MVRSNTRERRLLEPDENRGGAAMRRIVDVALKIIALHDEIVSGRGDHEPWRNRESRAQQFAQIGRFAAAEIEISRAQLTEIENKGRSIATRHLPVSAPLGAVLPPAMD